MLYRNKKTGVTIETLSECAGDWELVEKTEVEEAKAEPAPKPKKGKKK